MATMEQEQVPVQIQQPIRRPLPAAIAVAIETISWPLMPGDDPTGSSSSSSSSSIISPKMYFEPLEKMAQIRAVKGHHPYSNLNSTLHTTKTMLTFASTIASDIKGGIQSLCDHDKCKKKNIKENATKLNDTQEYTARIAVALLLLGHGYTDEAHCLISPLSWPRETHFGYGPPVAFSLDRDDSEGDDSNNINCAVLAAATYAHALVHRREGPNPSEFGRTGFQNADYWTSARSGGGEETLPVTAVQAAVEACAVPHGPLAVEWCARAAMDSVDWEPRFLHALCAQVVASCTGTAASVSAAAGEASTATSVITDVHVMGHFAQDAAAAELKVLLGHTLQLAGYNAAQCFPTSSSSGEVDFDTGTTLP